MNASKLLWGVGSSRESSSGGVQEQPLLFRFGVVDRLARGLEH